MCAILQPLILQQAFLVGTQRELLWLLDLFQLLVRTKRECSTSNTPKRRDKLLPFCLLLEPLPVPLSICSFSSQLFSFHQFHCIFPLFANYHRRENQLGKLLLIWVSRVNYCNSIWPKKPGKVSQLKRRWIWQITSMIAKGEWIHQPFMASKHP